MGSPLASILADLFMNCIEEEIEPLIYIYKEESLFVCVFVIYAFGHGMRECNQTLQGIPFRPGEGRRVVFDPKFSPHESVCPLPLLNYYRKCLFEGLCACDCFLNNSRTKVDKNCAFCHWAPEILRYLKENE